MSCDLCDLNTIVHLYDDSDPRFIIIDCMSCLVPMIVWRQSHTMSITPKDWAEMEIALRTVADKKFGKHNYYIDRQQRAVPDHLHWHARSATLANGYTMPEYELN